MKIKNIFNTAFLKLWLVLFALVPAIAAVIAATHEPSNPQPTGATIKDNLAAITELSFNASNLSNGKLEPGKYYDNNTWYYSDSGSSDNKTQSKGGETCITLTLNTGIIFKIAEPGNYKLTVTYYNTKNANGIWVYKGTEHRYLYESNEGYSQTHKTGDNCEEISHTISVAEPNECWQISGITTDNEYVHSITLTNADATAPELVAITQPYFWYYNGGADFGMANNGYPWGNNNHYRYLPGANHNVLRAANEVVVNGSKIEGQYIVSETDGVKEYGWRTGSYTFIKGDAIGIKLAKGMQYRIKVYYENNNSTNLLYKGVNASNLTNAISGSQTQINNSSGGDTNTRLMTYEIADGKDETYWITNQNNGALYIGGFEVLPYSSTSQRTVFNSTSWYVDNNRELKSCTLDGADNKTKESYLLKSGNGVDLNGPTLPVNSFSIHGHGTVQINNKNKVGLILKPGAKLTVEYVTDNSANDIVVVQDNNNNNLSGIIQTPRISEEEWYISKMEYTNPSTTTQEVWITTTSEKYVYFPGFTVEGGSDVVSIADAIPIESDYVWYPVEGHALFKDGTLLGDKYVFVYKDFQESKSVIYNTGQTKDDIKLHGQDKIWFRTNGDTQFGFKIAQGKRGVINLYYVAVDNRKVNLYQSNDPGSLGKTIGQTVSMGNSVNCVQYYFDTSDVQKTFWLKGGGSPAWFGGFEVLFEDSNNGGVDLANGAYYCNGTSTVKNALGNDTYNILKSESSAPLVGPSMLVNSFTEGNGVMVYARDNVKNGIMFKMSGTNNAVTVNGVVNNDAQIKIYKGDPSNGGTLLGTLSSTGEKKILLGEHTSSDVFYAVGGEEAGAYLISLVPATVNENQLVTIDNYTIYTANNSPNDGALLINKHFIFKGGVDQVIEPGMMVLGQTNKAFKITNGDDFYGFKVGESVDGKKTGYIKVYFNGGTSDSHVMQELPLDVALGAGWNSSYDQESHVISFTAGGGGRGWWFGFDEAGARDLSKYNKLNIELGEITGSPNLQVVVQSSNGAYTAFPLDEKGRLLGDLTDKKYWHTNTDGEQFDITKVSQIYIQDNNTDDTASSVEIKSARLMNKPLVIATGTIGKNQNGDETYDPANRSEVFGGIIHDVQNAHVYDFPFDLTKTDSNPQLYWVTGDINIAAIEVIYDDDENAKVVDWYVNKDTKMIVGSDDPHWVWSGFSKTEAIPYPSGYDEYVTFYVSGGRQAHVSFIMPEAVAEVVDWDKNNAAYGKHVIKPSVVNLNDKTSNFSFSFDDDGKTYDRKNQTATRNNIGTGDSNAKDLYGWYTYECAVPNDLSKVDNSNYYVGIAIKATQKPAPGDTKWNNEDIEEVNGKKGEWKIYMRFVSYKAPEVTKVNDIPVSGEKEGETISITSAGQGGTIYYTSDSSDPENLASGINEAHSSTNTYSGNFDVKKNCIVKAAQYLETPYQFFEDATLRNHPSNSFKLVSADHDVIFDKDNVVYVKNKKTNDNELFNTQEGGYMLTLPTGEKIEGKTPHEQYFKANPTMYLTLGGRDHPYLNGSSFSLCGTDWKASDDSGLKTYLDSYKYKFDVDSARNFSPWPVKDDKGKDLNQNQNPYTECNGGPGGANTEEGGMFLQPISGTMLRFEPEYDGVITVWLRQNGCLDNNNQEDGTFTRRPVYIMDENGRIMTRSTIKPTDEHYLGINGTYAINSNMCEQRSQVEHTWLYAVAKQVFEKHPVYADRFKNFPNRWVTDGIDHAGHILYGWWYKGFNIKATTEEITSADHLSRYEYMEPKLLYRSDNVYNMEMNNLGLKNNFAKYGYELPNFQYVRYRIPVKAGKTYYIAGRGTKNGFSAIQFDRVKCNTNINKKDFDALRFADNPTISEDTVANKNSSDYLKIKEEWSEVGSSTSLPTETAIEKSYEKVTNPTGSEYGNVNIDAKIKEDGGYPSNQWIIDLVLEHAADVTGGKGNLDGKTVEVVLNRTFTRGHWHPIILPFSVSETRLEQYFGEGTKVLYLDPYEHTVDNPTDSDGKRFISAYNQALINSKLYFTLHRYQMLYANTPAFICPTFTWSDTKKQPATDNVKPTVNADGTVSSITFKRVTIDGSNSRYKKGDFYGYAINEEYEIVGSYNSNYLTGDVYFIDHNAAGEAQLVHSNGNGNTVRMLPTRVWIRPIDPSRNNAPIRQVGAKTFSELDFGYGADEAGISDIVADDVTVEAYRDDSGVYDLLGRKMAEGSTDGLPAGVYIFQGKKIYVK